MAPFQNAGTRLPALLIKSMRVGKELVDDGIVVLRQSFHNDGFNDGLGKLLFEIALSDLLRYVQAGYCLLHRLIAAQHPITLVGQDLWVVVTVTVFGKAVVFK